MNAFLTLLLLSVSFLATAQKATNSSLNTSINDDGKTLSIQIEGQRDGQPIKYNRTFDVAKLNTKEKDALKTRIMDSLGIGPAPTPPVPQTAPTPSSALRPNHLAPTPPVPPSGMTTAGQEAVTFQCATCEGKIKLSVVSASENYSYERATKIDSDKPFFPHQLSLPPGEYRLKYYQNGVLQIQSTFTVKEGEKNSITVK